MSPQLSLTMQIWRFIVTGGLSAIVDFGLYVALLAAGLHVSRIDGSPMVFNDRDPWLPDFLVCRKELADDVLQALSGARRR